MHGRYALGIKLFPLTGKKMSANNVSLGVLLSGVARFLWKQ